MIRRFNYTGRIKIPRNRVDISLFKDNTGKYFKAKINLEGLNLPSEAKIYVEPNYKGVYQRFYFGTISNFKEPDNTRLDELPETELAYFDVSVVDEQSKVGLLLGKAKGIPVSADGKPNDRMPLLFVNPTDLKNQLWKLSFDSSDDGRPILEINKDIPELNEMMKNDMKFISLVYPAAFRGVLARIVEEGEFDAGDDSWITQWLKFLSLGLGIKSIPDINDENRILTSEQEAWIDECVNEYCKKFQLFEKFTSQ
ncbi:MAG: hypothetical protein JST75_02500 [Bacteroidetes bacterium]|nr:hypothetical protein [Bacteroidota bacterium]